MWKKVKNGGFVERPMAWDDGEDADWKYSGRREKYVYSRELNPRPFGIWIWCLNSLSYDRQYWYWWKSGFIIRWLIALGFHPRDIYILMGLKIVKFYSPFLPLLGVLSLFSIMYQKHALCSKQQVLFVMYCGKYYCMIIHTIWMKEKKNLCNFYKFKRHAIHKPGGRGWKTP